MKIINKIKVFFRKRKEYELRQNHKSNLIQNDLTLIKLQINQILKLLKDKKDG